MSNKNIETIIDFGASKIRLSVFESTLLKCIHNDEKEFETNLNINNLDLQKTEKVISKLIIDAEKKVNTHLNNISLMIDSPNIKSAAISIKKNFDGKKINSDKIKILLNECKTLIEKNYAESKVIHIIIDKFIIDEKIYYNIPNNDISCNVLVVEIKFLIFPNKLEEELNNIFKKNHISINEIYSSSYLKSYCYNNIIENYKEKFFLDIGHKKTCLILFDKNRLILFKTIPIGSNHITKDISQVLNIDSTEAEKIKKILNKSEITFSDQVEDELKIDTSDYINKKLPNDILQKVIYARIEEIISLSFHDTNHLNLKDNNNSILIFTGEGSRILDKNNIYLKDEFNYFDEIKFFEESSNLICQSVLKFKKINNLNDVNLLPRKVMKIGFFERFFQFFGGN